MLEVESALRRQPYAQSCRQFSVGSFSSSLSIWNGTGEIGLFGDCMIQRERGVVCFGNAFVESFNGTFRAKCLDTNCFQSLPEASQIAASRDLAETKTGRELTI